MSQILQNLSRLADEVVRLAPMGVIVFDELQVVRVANIKAAELLCGDISCDGKSFVGQPLSDILPGFDPETVDESSSRKKLLIDDCHRFLDFKIVELELDGGKWTAAYFEEADQRHRRELLLEKEASTDELSGLANRRAFQRTMESNQHRPLSLAIVDVDYFKNVNDTHGHLVGDDVVRHMGRILSTSFSTNSILVSRMGGDEFSVLFETSDDDSIVQSLENFRVLVADEVLPGHDIQLSVSIGAAISKVTGVGSRTLLTHADRQLYLAKESGRNRLSQVSICESVGDE